MQTMLHDIGVYASKERVGKYKNVNVDANKPKQLKSSNETKPTDTSHERPKLEPQNNKVRWEKYASAIEGKIEMKVQI